MKTKKIIKHHFRFIELIIILVLLAAMLSVLQLAISRLREMATKNICMDNLKVMGKAAQAYAADSDGWLPFSGLAWYKKNKIGGKMDAWISSSIASKNVAKFQCPEDSIPMDKRASGANKLWSKLEKGGGMVKLSYGINLVLTGIPKNPWLKAHRLDDIEEPEDCFLIGDAKKRDINSPSSFDYRHNKTANAVFVDGHVDSLKKVDVPKFNSSKTQAFWLGGYD